MWGKYTTGVIEQYEACRAADGVDWTYRGPPALLDEAERPQHRRKRFTVAY